MKRNREESRDSGHESGSSLSPVQSSLRSYRITKRVNFRLEQIFGSSDSEENSTEKEQVEAQTYNHNNNNNNNNTEVEEEVKKRAEMAQKDKEIIETWQPDITESSNHLRAEARLNPMISAKYANRYYTFCDLQDRCGLQFHIARDPIKNLVKIRSTMQRPRSDKHSGVKNYTLRISQRQSKRGEKGELLVRNYQIFYEKKLNLETTTTLPENVHRNAICKYKIKVKIKKVGLRGAKV